MDAYYYANRRRYRRSARYSDSRTDRPAFCFQGHPEASPGPHDIAYLFDRFTALMEKHKTENKNA